MSGVVLVPPRYQFFDAIGNPLANGTVDVFLAGTTTRTSSWQDQAQTSLNANPIVLDGSGSCTMVVDNALSYKLVVKNSAGATQPHAGGDNIRGAAGGLDLLNFTQAGTGAVVRTAQDKMREVVSVKDFGAVGDGVTNDTTKIQAAATYASSVGRSLYIPGGTYIVSSTVTVSAAITVYGDGNNQSILRPTITDGSVCLQVGGVTSMQFAKLRDFAVVANISTANFLTGGINGQNCTGIALGSASASCNRWSVSNVRATGCKKGWYIRGFIGTAENLWADYCETGLDGTLLNSTDLNLRFENNRKDFVIGDSDSVLFRQLIQEGGNTTGVVASTIDACRGVVMHSHYTEWGSGINRPEPYIVFGGTTECLDVVINGSKLTGPMSFGVYPLKLDRVDGAEVSVFCSVGDRNVSVETTANTKNYRLNATQTLKFIGVHDASKQLGPCFNYFPNRNFDLWFRGWANVAPLRATISQETTLVRKGGNAVKILCTVGQVNSFCQWQISGPSVTYLRSKTVRAYAWVWVPDIPDYDESVASGSRMLPSLILGDFDGANAQSSATRNTGYKKNSWQLMESADLVVQNDATRIDLTMFANNQPAVTATGDEYVVVDSIYIVESSTPFSRVLNDDIADSPYIDAIGVAGRMVFYSDTAPTDADQVFAQGDIVHKLTPAAAGSPGWVCTTGGVGGVAVFKAMANVAA